jgi:hypothetical protein
LIVLPCGELDAEALSSLELHLSCVGNQVTVDRDVDTSKPERLQLVKTLPIEGAALDKETCAKDLPG